MSRRPYTRKVERSWWLQHPRYVAYMIRELTSLFVGLYCALLAVGLVRLAQGQAAWEGFVAALSSPLGVAFQLVCLVFADLSQRDLVRTDAEGDAADDQGRTGARHSDRRRPLRRLGGGVDRRVDRNGNLSHGKIE